jgi:signal transduction histidine kinase
MATGQGKRSLNGSLPQLAEHLRGKDAVRLSSFLVRAPLFIFFTLVTFAGSPDHNIGHVILAAAAGVTVEASILYSVRPLLSKMPGATIWPIWSAYWLAGEISGIVLLVSLNVPFVRPGEGVSAWVILAFNGFLAVVWLTAANLAAGLLAKDIQVLRELGRETVKLERLKRDAASRLLDEVAALNQIISEKVLELLKRINKQLEGLSSNTPNTELLMNAKQVRELCESEVRSLSHDIASKPFEPLTEAVSLPKILSPWGSSRAKASDIKLRLRWVASIGVFNALAIALQRGGWFTAAACLLLISIGIVVIQGLDAWRLKTFRTESALATGLLIAGEYLVMSLAAMLFLWVLGFNEPEVARFVSAVYVTVPVVLVIIWLLAQLIQDSARRLRLYGRELLEKRALLESTLSDIERKSSRTRKSLGRFLHGSIQGRLASVSMALAVAAKTSSKVMLDELLTQARRQLELSAFEVSQVVQGVELEEGASLEAEIHQLKEGWKNLVELSFEVTEGANEYLGSRKELTELVVEAMRECITNAVRHGHAKRVSVHIGLGPHPILRVRNDGLPIEKLTPGFGITSISLRTNGVQVSTADGWSEVSLSWPTEPSRF